MDTAIPTVRCRRITCAAADAELARNEGTDACDVTERGGAAFSTNSSHSLTGERLVQSWSNYAWLQWSGHRHLLPFTTTRRTANWLAASFKPLLAASYMCRKLSDC